MSGTTATMTTPETSSTHQVWRKASTSWRAGFMGLAVHLAQNDVQRTDDRDHVGHQMPARHFVQRLQVDEGRRANAHAIRLRRAITHNVIAQDALGRLDGMI